MVRARPSVPHDPALRDSARVAAWSVGLSGLAAALGALLEAHRAGSLAVQAFVVEWGAGRLGVAWSDPTAPPPTTGDVVRRACRGALLGLGAALVTLSFALLTGGASLSRAPVNGSELLLGVVVALFSAARDELLLRGLVLRAFRHTLPVRSALPLAVCGAVAAAARVAEVPGGELRPLFTSVTGLATLAIAALGGVCLTTLWLRDRGAWVALGAHAAWTLVTTTVLAGGLCDARWASSAWGGGPGGMSSSLAVVVPLAGITAAASHAWYRASSGRR